MYALIVRFVFVKRTEEFLVLVDCSWGAIKQVGNDIQLGLDNKNRFSDSEENENGKEHQDPENNQREFYSSKGKHHKIVLETQVGEGIDQPLDTEGNLLDGEEVLETEVNQQTKS